jgi:hypothetical protein
MHACTVVNVALTDVLSGIRAAAGAAAAAATAGKALAIAIMHSSL